MKKLILIILFLKSFSICAAQLDSVAERDEWKVFAATGFGSGLTSHELNFPLKIFVLKNEHGVFSRVQSCFDLGMGPKSPEIRTTELAILYAYNTSAYSDIGNTYFTFGAGIGYLNGVGRGKLTESGAGWFGDYEHYEKVIVSTAGLALEIQAINPVTDWFGIGGNIYANINPQYTLYGVNFTLYFGNL